MRDTLESVFTISEYYYGWRIWELVRVFVTGWPAGLQRAQGSLVKRKSAPEEQGLCVAHTLLYTQSLPHSRHYTSACWMNWWRVYWGWNGVLNNKGMILWPEIISNLLITMYNFIFVSWRTIFKIWCRRSGKHVYPPLVYLNSTNSTKRTGLCL